MNQENDLTFSYAEKDVTGIILAAGMGKRMGGSLPKALHKLNGEPMIQKVISTLSRLSLRNICLIVPEKCHEFNYLLRSNQNLTACSQSVRNGTAGAVGVAGYSYKDVTPPTYAHGQLIWGQQETSEYSLICAGDTPAVSYSSLKEFISTSLKKDWDIAVCGMNHPTPYGYGRLILDEKNNLEAICEEKDASDEVKKITFCNTGIILARTSLLFSLLQQITDNNKQNEYYLTDCIAIANRLKMKVGAYIAQDWKNFQGVNTPEQLKQLELDLK